MRHFPKTILVLAATAGFASAVDPVTSYTVPVGYVTLNVPASADSTITPPLNRPPLYSGASISISSNDVGATGLTANEFVTTKSYLKVTSGPLEGMFFPISANTTSIITVDPGATSLQDLGFVSGNTFKVIPYWTLDTLFPGGAGVGGTTDVENPNSYVFLTTYDGIEVNRASDAAYFYASAGEINSMPEGWYDLNDPFGSVIGDTAIAPTAQYIIRKDASAATVTIEGEVPATKSNAEVAIGATPNDNHFGVPYPVDISLQESGLQSVIEAATDVENPPEYVFVFDDEGPGFNKPASFTYFYCGEGEINSMPPGWYDLNDPFGDIVTAKVLKAGRCFFVRKAGGTPGTIDWVAPLPYAP